MPSKRNRWHERLLRLGLVGLMVGASACATGSAAGRLHRPSAAAAATGRERGLDALVRGDAPLARAALAQALTQDPTDVRTLYGLSLLQQQADHPAEERALLLRLLEQATRPDASAPGSAVLAELAAVRLQTLLGEAPDDASLTERLQALDSRRLTFETRDRLLDIRAQLVREQGDEPQARQLDALRGCPARWHIAGPYGHLPHRFLARHLPADDGEFSQRSTDGRRAQIDHAESRGCVFYVTTPAGMPGVAYATVWVETRDSAGLMLRVSATTDWHALVDGVTVWRADDERQTPPTTRRLQLALAPGWHRLSIKLAAASSSLPLEVTLAAGNGDGPAHPVMLRMQDEPPPAPVFDPQAAAPPRATALALDSVASGPTNGSARRLADFMLAQAALRDGDPQHAQPLLDRLGEQAPRFFAALLLAAQAAAADASQPSRFGRDRSRRLLERALAIDPTAPWPRRALAALDLAEDQPDKTLERLQHSGREPDPRDWRSAMLRYHAFRQRGFEPEADRALMQARHAAPWACPPLEAAFTRAKDHHDRNETATLAQALVRCDPTTSALAELARERGDLATAASEYRRLLALDPGPGPGPTSVRLSLADVLAASGQRQEALALHRALADQDPGTATYRRLIADDLIALAMPAQARAVLLQALAELPWELELHRAWAALGGEALMAPYRLPGERVIAEFVRRGAHYDAPAVFVLDRTVVRAFANGAQLVLTHNIIRVQNKDGIAKWGETTVPQDAQVLTLRTVKADGSTREPEEIAEKQSVSLPDLEPGDYVELEWLQLAPPPAAFPGGLIADRFYFQSFDAPLDRSEYLLAVPLAFKPPALVFDRRGPAPVAVVEARRDLIGEVTLHGFYARTQPALVAEPEAAPAAEHIASVRAAHGVSLAGWRDYLREQSFATLRPNFPLQQLARRLGAGKDPAASVRAVDAWVRHNIEMRSGDSLFEPATAILARGQGHRVPLEQALLGQLGISTTPYLVRPEHAAALDGELPDLEAYDEVVLRLPEGLSPGWLDPRLRHVPSGLLWPALRGKRGYALDDASAVSWTTLPAASTDQRDIEIDADLDPQGSANVRVVEQLRGWPAAEYREALEQIAPDRLRAEFEQRLLGFYFPGAALADLSVGGHDDLGPLELRYRFSAPRYARAEGDRLVVGAAYPALLGRRYIGTARRLLPLEIAYVAPTTLRERLHLQAGASMTMTARSASPDERVEERDFGRFALRVTAARDMLTIERRFAMSPLRMAPARYPELMRFAEDVDAAEARAAEILLATPPR